MNKVGTPAAIVLAGGRGARLGGMTKPDLVVGGQRMLDLVLDAVAGCEHRVVVAPGDTEVPAGVLLTRELPPLTGPASGLAAGLACLEALGPVPEWVVVLACDLPGVAGAIGPLIDAAGKVDDDIEALSATTGEEERIQWLVSIVRTASLRRAVDRLGPAGVIDASMGRLLGGLRWDFVRVPPGTCDDIDTWEDHATWLNAHETI